MRNTITSMHSITFEGWLTLDLSGTMKLSRGQPSLAPGQRAMKLSVQVPKALFRTPELKATINVPTDTAPPQIDAQVVTAIENAVKAGVGLDLTVTIGEPE